MSRRTTKKNSTTKTYFVANFILTEKFDPACLSSAFGKKYEVLVDEDDELLAKGPSVFCAITMSNLLATEEDVGVARIAKVCKAQKKTIKRYRGQYVSMMELTASYPKHDDKAMADIGRLLKAICRVPEVLMWDFYSESVLPETVLKTSESDLVAIIDSVSRDDDEDCKDQLALHLMDFDDRFESTDVEFPDVVFPEVEPETEDEIELIEVPGDLMAIAAVKEHEAEMAAQLSIERLQAEHQALVAETDKHLISYLRKVNGEFHFVWLGEAFDFDLFYRKLRYLGITPEHIQAIPGGLYVMVGPYALFVEHAADSLTYCPPFVRESLKHLTFPKELQERPGGLEAFLNQLTVVRVTVRMHPVSDLTLALAAGTVRLFAKLTSSVAITHENEESYTVGDVIAMSHDALKSYVEGHIFAVEQPPVVTPAML